MSAEASIAQVGIEARQSAEITSWFLKLPHKLEKVFGKKFSIGLREIKSAVYYARFQNEAW